MLWDYGAGEEGEQLLGVPSHWGTSLMPLHSPEGASWRFLGRVVLVVHDLGGAFGCLNPALSSIIRKTPWGEGDLYHVVNQGKCLEISKQSVDTE